MAETALLLARKAAEVLAERGIAEARLDAELLLAHVLGISRLQLYLQFDRPLADEELARFRALVRRRLKREPVQYITGVAHFRELELHVDPRVLIPRPETEELVGQVLDWAWAQVGGKPGKRPGAIQPERESGGAGERGPGGLGLTGDSDSGAADGTVGNAAAPAVAREMESPAPPLSGAEGEGAAPRSADKRLLALDVGTGSGAIALSLLKEGPFARVVATDASAEALEVARANAERLGLSERVDFRLGSLWQAVPDEAFDVVAANPPYVAEPERPALAPEVREWEPAGALFAGGAGFDVLEPLIAGAAAHLRPGGLLALEIGAAQAAGTLERIEATGAFVGARVARDLAGRDRVALATRGASESLANEAERREHA